MKKTVLSAVLGFIAGTVAGRITTSSSRGKDIEKWKVLSDKHFTLFMLMNEWMKSKQEGRSIGEYFEKKGYKTIAIYGMSYVGERLLDELMACGIEVKYAIDQNAETIYSDIKMFSPKDNLPKVDLIVVTAVYYYEDVCRNLADKVECPIVSLEDILL